MRVSADIDERTLREIYLPAFEAVVKRAHPWTVMCAYNAVNGVFSSQNHWLLTEVLRDEWGYDGMVVSDWGAVVDRVEGLRAGLDLEMPGPAPRNDKRIVQAVRNGSLDEAILDTAVARILTLVSRASAAATDSYSCDIEAHHLLARRAAAASAVPLKNDSAVLPITSPDDVVVIGEFARTSCYQGAGSSKVNPTPLILPSTHYRKCGATCPSLPDFPSPISPIPSLPTRQSRWRRDT